MLKGFIRCAVLEQRLDSERQEFEATEGNGSSPI
jgi:hypothetical protein